jgi:hypothetical protein
MRQSNKSTPRSKHLARLKYKERKIDTFIKWSIKRRGGLRWRDLMFIHEQYKIECYGQKKKIK